MHVHSLLYLAKGPRPLPKPILQTVTSSASCFNFQYPFVSLKPSSSCLRPFPYLPAPSIVRSNVPSITCFIRQFLCNMWPIQLTFHRFILRRMFVSTYTLRSKSPFLLTRSAQELIHSSPAHFRTFKTCLICSSSSTKHSNVPAAALQPFLPYINL